MGGGTLNEGSCEGELAGGGKVEVRPKMGEQGLELGGEGKGGSTVGWDLE